MKYISLFFQSVFCLSLPFQVFASYSGPWNPEEIEGVLSSAGLGPHTVRQITSSCISMPAPNRPIPNPEENITGQTRSFYGSAPSQGGHFFDHIRHQLSHSKAFPLASVRSPSPDGDIVFVNIESHLDERNRVISASFEENPLKSGTINQFLQKNSSNINQVTSKPYSLKRNELLDRLYAEQTLLNSILHSRSPSPDSRSNTRQEEIDELKASHIKLNERLEELQKRLEEKERSEYDLAEELVKKLGDSIPVEAGNFLQNQAKDLSEKEKTTNVKMHLSTSRFPIEGDSRPLSEEEVSALLIYMGLNIFLDS